MDREMDIRFLRMISELYEDIVPTEDVVDLKYGVPFIPNQVTLARRKNEVIVLRGEGVQWNWYNKSGQVIATCKKTET